MSTYSVGACPANPFIYNVTMTLADTEYSQQLPRSCKKYLIHTRDESEFRLAFATGIVAVPAGAYLTVLEGTRFYEETVNLRVVNADWDGTLYFASDVTLKVIEIVAWT